MKTLKDIEHLQGVRALVRVDFNVPIRNGAVTDDYRIRTALPTIDFLRAKGAKVILISHLESSDGGNPSLEPVARHLNKLGQKAGFIKDFKAAYIHIEHEMKDGDCILLENLRFFDGEKNNDQKFAQELAPLGDVYVNEAFSVSHREHASIVSVPRIIPGYAGLQLEKEVANLSRAFDPAHPFLFILGGAKFETKLPLIERFLKVADTVFIGGAIANDFFKHKGYEVGVSLVSKTEVTLEDPKIMLPADVINQNHETKLADGLSTEDKILDDGAKTLAELKVKIDMAKFILWNGPLGMYEDGFKEGTLELAKLVAEAAGHGAETIVGGGDTLAAIKELNNEGKFTFVSTGGGAMLDFLAKGTLPGIEALEKAE